MQPKSAVAEKLAGFGIPMTESEIFHAVMNETTLLALHKKRFWQKSDGLHLDIGPFVAAIADLPDALNLLY